MLIYSAIASLTYIVVIFIVFYILRDSKKPVVKSTKLKKTNKETNEQKVPKETVPESEEITT
tara:strand:- start:608 stop:793 length:186 start_codon:yes stop_codon:yes gene_type:complete